MGWDGRTGENQNPDEMFQRGEGKGRKDGVVET